MANPKRGLLLAVNRSIKSMSWLSAKDDAAVELAREYARQIDEAVRRGGQDATKGMHLGPHLLKALDALGGTPASDVAPPGRPVVVDESEEQKPDPAGQAPEPKQGVRDELARIRDARRSRASVPAAAG